MVQEIQTLTKEALMGELSLIVDPEIGYSIVDLGLIYDVHIHGTEVKVIMTFTSPFCPVGDIILQNVNDAVKKFNATAKVDVTFDPPWSPEKIKPELKAALGIEVS